MGVYDPLPVSYEGETDHDVSSLPGYELELRYELNDSLFVLAYRDTFCILVYNLGPSFRSVSHTLASLLLTLFRYIIPNTVWIFNLTLFDKRCCQTLFRENSYLTLFDRMTVLLLLLLLQYWRRNIGWRLSSLDVPFSEGGWGGLYMTVLLLIMELA